jgi:hypothetical protein
VSDDIEDEDWGLEMSNSPTFGFRDLIEVFRDD